MIRLCTAVASLLLDASAVSGAQGYDPQTQSPLSLLAAPRDPIAYLDARTRAWALLREGKAAEAEPLAAQVTRDYPRDGQNWHLLGEVKSSLKKDAEAAAAFERAGKLFSWGGPETFAGKAATAHMKAGNRLAAMDMLRLVISEEGAMNRSWIYGQAIFAALRSDPEFLEIAGRPDTSGWTRDIGWQRDVDFLRSEVKRLNAEYRTSPLPPEFERRYEALRQNVHRLSNEEIYVGLNRMLAVLHQGHTQVRALSDTRVVYKGLPIQLWAFPEGLFVVAAGEQHQDLVGSRLVAIEGVPAEDVLRRVNENQSVDGDNEYISFGVQYLRDAPYLVGLGIAESVDSIRVALEKPGQRQRNITLRTTPWYAPRTLVPVKGIATPLYLRDLAQQHWTQALPEHDAMYVQLNAVLDDKDETLDGFGLRLRDMLGAGTTRNLILDMRHNGGGSSSMYAELLRTMIGFSILPERRVYVLVGRNTYSAAGNLITELEQLAGAVFVGEASSECCTMYASPTAIRLPFSNLWANVSTKKWSLSRKPHDFRRELNPHAPVVVTAKDFFAGRDPAMDTVTRLIERAKPGK